MRGAVHAGGACGALVSGLLRSGFNFGGALIVTLACFVTALFLTTSFSFSGTHAWAMSSTGPIGAAQKLGILQRAQAKWHAWQEDREQKRMLRQVEANRTVGRKPAPSQSIGSAAVFNEPPKTIHLADEGDVFRGVTSTEAEEDEKPAHKTPILVLNQEKPEKTPARKSLRPEDCKGKSAITNCLR